MPYIKQIEVLINITHFEYLKNKLRENNYKNSCVLLIIKIYKSAELKSVLYSDYPQIDRYLPT